MDLVIINVESEETIERWEFEISPEKGDGKEDLENSDPLKRTSNKKLADIQQQIMKIMRQIIATVSMLPNYEDDITFKMGVAKPVAFGQFLTLDLTRPRVSCSVK